MKPDKNGHNLSTILDFIVKQIDKRFSNTCTYLFTYVCAYVCMAMCRHVCLSVCMFVCLSAVCLYVYLPACLSVCMYVCLYVNIYNICLSVRMSACMSVWRKASHEEIPQYVSIFYRGYVTGIMIYKNKKNIYLFEAFELEKSWSTHISSIILARYFGARFK